MKTFSLVVLGLCSLASSAMAQSVETQVLDSNFARVPASSLQVQLPGDATPTPLSIRIGDGLDVRGQGARLNGTFDDYPAYVAAQAKAQARGGTRIFTPSGSRVSLPDGVIFTAPGNSWEFGANVQVNGTIQGLLDNISGFAHTFSKATNFGGNDTNLFVSMTALPTTGAPSYQKNVLYNRGEQDDPSSYTNGTFADASVAFHDLVGVESIVGMGNGVQTGRLFGYHSSVNVPAGTDGLTRAAEFEVYNASSYQPYWAKGTSKNAMQVNCSGTVDCTAGMVFSGSAARFRRQVVFNRANLRTDGFAWELMDQNAVADTTETPAIAALDYFGNLSATTVQTKYVQTVAALVAGVPCTAATEGTRASVSDAASPTFLGTLAGGGAIHSPAYCNGTAWVAG